MRTLYALAAGLLLLPATAHADGELDKLAGAMGADKVKAIEYAGSGFVFAVGQSPRPGMPWPKFNLKSYKLTANYDTASMTRDLTVTQFEDPPRGGGRQPVVGEQRRRGGISGTTGWRYRGKRAGPSRGTAGLLHALWTTPHGVIKAAQGAGAKVETRTSGGKTFKTVSFGQPGAFQATAWFNGSSLLEKVEARVANTVLGDMPVVTTYADYKDFNGTKFPGRITATAGGFPSFDLTVTEVRANGPADIKPPQGLRPPSNRVKVDKAADGVWFLTGGSHHSIAIEMSDHVIVFEGPLHDGRAGAVIDAVKKTIPGKPVRFVVNTHHHFDHSGGLRGFAAEGATIVTHEVNKAFYEATYAAPRKIVPDRLAKSGKSAKILAVGAKHVMGDGTRTLELHHVKGNLHNDGLLIGYLPKEKILMVADAYSGRGLRKAPAKTVNPFTANLWENLERLELDIATVLPIHGQKVAFEQVRFAAGK